MLSAVLSSPVAVKISIQIMNAFVEMRRIISDNTLLFQRMDRIELKQLETDRKILQVFQALEQKNPRPQQGIFFDGQIFDAYLFVTGIIKVACREIILIDNYIDKTVLTILSKRKSGVSAHIYTRRISKQLQIDIEKHNSQYQPIIAHTLPFDHDRFLIIDRKELYHIGASLKDLGKKWFAFSRMDIFTEVLLKRLEESE